MKLDLISFDGNYLYATFLKDGRIGIYDQNDSLSEIFNTPYDLLDFIDGERNVSDSNGYEWEWNVYSTGAKSSLRDIYAFLSNSNLDLPNEDQIDDAAEYFLSNYDGSVDWDDLKYIFKQGAEYIKEQM